MQCPLRYGHAHFLFPSACEATVTRTSVRPPFSRTVRNGSQSDEDDAEPHPGSILTRTQGKKYTSTADAGRVTLSKRIIVILGLFAILVV
jgi:hypothetical protein